MTNLINLNIIEKKLNIENTFVKPIIFLFYLIHLPALIASYYTRPSLNQIADDYVAQREKNTLLSTYGHENIFTDSEMHANCYGFVNFILEKHFQAAHAQILSFMLKHKAIPISIDGIPCPFHFSAMFNMLRDKPGSSSSFEYVPYNQIQPGDIIIYEPLGHAPQAGASFSTKPTGMHIMIVNKVASSFDDTYILEIIDCTKGRHDSIFDSRACYPKGKRGGIGRARLHLIKNGSGDFDRLKWFPSGKIYHKAITVGRLRRSIMQ